MKGRFSLACDTTRHVSHGRVPHVKDISELKERSVYSTGESKYGRNVYVQ